MIGWVLAPLMAVSMMEAPEWTERGLRQTTGNYPRWAVLRGASAVVVFQVWVDPEGEPYQCKTIDFAGNERLANSVCKMIQDKAEFTPARDALGNPTHGVHQSIQTYILVGAKDSEELLSLKQKPDIRMKQPGVAETHPEGVEFEVIISADAAGKVLDCKGHEAAPEELALKGCEALNRMTLQTIVDRDGQPVPYVTTLTISVTAE